MTRAILAEELRAGPTEYDAAPTYLVRLYRENSARIERQLLSHLTKELTDKVQPGSRSEQIQTAIELASPGAAGIVRAGALVSEIFKITSSLSTPAALLAIPVLFFTGKKTFLDIRRALIVDPAVRDLVKRAQSYSDDGDFKGAEALLKEALSQDINPDYPRNGDLYLQLGMIQAQDRRPREAMVSFAKASVLFNEDDVFRFTAGEGEAKVSKRGMAELLASAAIDSFAHDREGLAEWSSLLSDFAASAERLLENFAAQADTGVLFGLFGVDSHSAELGRELAAKVRFLSAKMKLRSAGLGVDQAEIDQLLQAALKELRDAALEPQELFRAIFEQAQFYCDFAVSESGAVSESDLHRALYLLEEAALTIQDVDPLQAAQVRAEAAAYLLKMLPNLSTSGPLSARMRRQLPSRLEDLAEAVEPFKQTMEFAPLFAGWIEEELYHLADSQSQRAAAAQRAHQAYLDAEEPVAAMQNAMRIASNTDDEDERRLATSQVMEAAQALLNSPSDPVSEAFASKYLLNAVQDSGHMIDAHSFKKTGELFLKASEYVKSHKYYVAFSFKGQPILHPWRVAQLILQGQGARKFAAAGEHAAALSIYEELCLRAQDLSSPRVQRALELEYAQLLIEMGDLRQAKSLLDSLLKAARHDGQDTQNQHRALELLQELQRAQDDELLQASDPANLLAIEDKDQPTGLLSSYAKKRDQLLAICHQVLEISQQTGAFEQDRSSTAFDRNELLQGRLDRLQEGKLRLGIVGEFSAGKSTFLNALLGDLILPSSIRPTTATIIRLQWGQEPRVDLLFLDGTSQTIAFDDLATYVTERRNPQNKLGVSEVRIFYPLPLLQNGVELIDTPGVASLFEAHTKITYDLIPGCDAVVLLATGRQPFSASIAKFLEDLRLVVDGKIFYVLNKIDQLEEPGASDAIRFAHDQVAEYVQGAKVIPLSAYQALFGRLVEAGKYSEEDLEHDPRLGGVHDPQELITGSNIASLEQTLSSFLERHRGLPMLREVGADFIRALTEMDQILSTELTTAEMDMVERREKHRLLASQHHQLQMTIEARLEELERELRTTCESIVHRPSSEIPELLESIISATDITTDDVASQGAIELLQQRITSITRRAIEDYISALTKDLSKALAWYQNTARRELRRFQRELQAEFRANLNLPEPTIDAAVPISNYELGLDVNNIGEGFTAFMSSFAITGFLGFFGTIFLGPLGIGIAMLASFFGSGFIGEMVREERVNKATEALRQALQESLSEIGNLTSEKLTEAAREIIASGVETIHEFNHEIQNEFDQQLTLLIEDYSSTENTQRERLNMLRRSQRELSRLRDEIVKITF